MKEYCLRLFKMVVFLLIVVVIYKALSYAFVDDTESMARVTFHDYYEQEGDIDILFIGTSHTQRGIDTNMLSEQLGVDCFNLATAAQRLSGTYYLAQDAIAKNNLTDLYVEFSIPGISSEDDTYSTYTMSDYMQLSLSKIKYLTNVLPEEAFTDKWMPLCRTINITEGLDVKKAAKTVKEKSTSDMYKSYQATPDSYEYAKRGAWKNTSETTWGDLLATQYKGEDFFVSPESFNQTQMNYLDKLIKECKENNVNLTLMVMPFSDLYIAGGVEEYVESVMYMEQYCLERGVSFVDFNHVSKEELVLGNDCFSDMDHLNAKGSEIFSEFLVQYMQGEREITWYQTIEDRIAQNQDFYGVVYERENDWENAEMYFEVMLVGGTGEPITWVAEVIDEDESTGALDIRIGDTSFYVDVPMEYMGKILRLNALSDSGNVLFTSTILL